jgi:hypothetical protein
MLTARVSSVDLQDDYLAPANMVVGDNIAINAVILSHEKRCPQCLALLWHFWLSGFCDEQFTVRTSQGWIGAFVNKTNVSVQRFREGCFEKGIILRIPLDWIAPIHSQTELDMDFRPIQREGGQRLSCDTLLYYATRRVSQDELNRGKENAPQP